jgi:hypothetical protein
MSGEQAHHTMKNEIDVLRDLAGKFARVGIEYMLTGSLAMNYYAQPRMTRDIDIVVAVDSKDAETIASLFSSDYYVVREAIVRAIARQSVFNLIHHETVIKVDCIVRKSSYYRREEFERRSTVTLQDFTFWIASKEDLIISKLDWARDSRSELQLRDVRNLLATGCDVAYLEKWTRELGLYDFWQECLHE